MKSFGRGPTATAPIISESSRLEVQLSWMFLLFLWVSLDFHPLYYNWAAQAFGRLVPVMRWWMFQSELYFVRPPRRPGRRRTEPAGQFHQIIWFIGKINWVLQKLYSSTQHRGWLAAVTEIHISLSHSLPNLNPRPLIFSFVVAKAFIIIIWFLTSIYLGGCSEAKLWLYAICLMYF